jgi:predicted CXXCH cytochrome family protein
MKRAFVGILSLGLLAVFAVGVSGQIENSAHDLSNRGWNSEGEICIVCHTPHDAMSAVPSAPLWNHEVSATATYSTYTSASMDATVGQPSAESKLCLACHDGTVALDNYGGMTTGSTPIGALWDVGTDLSDDHPISITYDATLATADGELFDPTTQTTVLGGTIDGDLLFGGQVQCASCHDVHNHYNNASLLVIPNSDSDLCLTCHNK